MIEHQGTDTRLVQPAEDNAWGRPRAVLLQEAPEQREPGSQRAAWWDDQRQWQKLKRKDWTVGWKEKSAHHEESSKALEKTVQKGCEVSILASFQNLTG